MIQLSTSTRVFQDPSRYGGAKPENVCSCNLVLRNLFAGDICIKAERALPTPATVLYDVGQESLISDVGGTDSRAMQLRMIYVHFSINRTMTNCKKR